MKRILTCLTFVLAAGTAGAQDKAGGFTGPDSAKLVTVAELGGLQDETPVKLRGYIVKAQGDENYEFKDATGTVTVEIDDEDWNGVKATPETLVELRGEVDKDFTRTELDVDSVQLVQ